MQKMVDDEGLEAQNQKASSPSKHYPLFFSKTQPRPKKENDSN